MLVNSAGVGIAGTLAELTPKHFDLQLDVNLRGLLLVTQAAMPLLRESHGLDRQPRVDRGHAADARPRDLRGDEGRGHLADAVAQRRSSTATASARSRSAPASSTRRWPRGAASAGDEMIQPEDCAEVVRMCLRLSPRARIPQVVIERMGSTNGDVPVSGA